MSRGRPFGEECTGHRDEAFQQAGDFRIECEERGDVGKGADAEEGDLAGA